MEKEESELLKELRELRKQLEAKEPEGSWFVFETRVDAKGRLNIPPDKREEMGIYGKAAKVSVKVNLIKLYGETKDARNL